MEGHTQGHLKRNREDVLFRIPKTSYFRTRYREISMIVVHSSEIETKKSLILKEKRLDLLGRKAMPDTISNIVYSFSSQLKVILGNKLSKVILYGSYARGDYQKNSDVDIMILVNMPDAEIKNIENEIYDLAFDVELETGLSISPVIKNEESYIYWLDALPYYKNVNNEGIVING